jgi:L-seryl-tRNA(Ser) seleniumtransferase
MNKHDRRETLRLLPSIDALLQTATAAKIRGQSGAKHLTVLARALTDALRREMLDEQVGDKNHTREELLAKAEKNLETLWRDEQNSGLRRVINATGVIVHTNLGRAPLSENAVKALTENASRYCALEYDLTTGRRGRRGARVENLLAELVGAESALVVNNCAAAAFLVLNVLARGGEAIVSRGELVEIGGDFRIPDVMEQSGAILREVGTTNRTRVSDYERAVSENTKLILRVHPSNYRIVGFTHAPALSELAELAREKDILLYEDAGSGAMFDLSQYGLTDEPVINDSIRAGADVVTFSGDKLLGGAQSGLIVGRREAIEKIRKHPLYRALRVDKLIYAALEATLESFRRGSALQEIPVLKMLSATIEELKTRSSEFAEKLNKNRGANKDLKIEIAEGKSVVGGGSAPTAQPATILLALEHSKMSAAKLEETLRFSDPPIITRILDEKVLIDLRTISESEEAELLGILGKI